MYHTEYEKSRVHGHLLSVQWGFDFFRAIDRLVEEVQYGASIWGGMVGCRKVPVPVSDGAGETRHGWAYRVTFVGDEGEEAEVVFDSPRRAVWEYMRLASVGGCNITLNYMED
jgi:hypothetical protein